MLLFYHTTCFFTICKKARKKAYKEKLKQLNADYRLKLREYRKSKRKGVTSQGGDDNINVDVNKIDNGQDIDYEKFNKERNELIRKQQEELKAKQNKHKKTNKKGTQ